ncbi:MAG: endonuclease III domain-containing protein [Actinobacteria bacterium]|nr:endonuclease III domain-containing protein [Actinomycetota bacterium]
MSTIRQQLLEFYETLLAHFGPQNWWPGDTPFEVMVGAILTQNTNWKNVSKAMANLKQANLLDPHRLLELDREHLTALIKPAGYFNIKAKRLHNLLTWLIDRFEGDVESAKALDTETLRAELLNIKGIGRETADSILLYGFEKLIFVVDTYTCRILWRHRLLDEDMDYDYVQEIFTDALPAEVQLYNEYHALLVALGKTYCRPRPNCVACPLSRFPHCLEDG